jgi:2-dehydro-3-deoxygluconokinase
MGEFCAVPGEGLYQLGAAGDSFNTAVYLARQGVSVDYLTCLGEDRVSLLILQRIADEGIGSGRIRILSGRNAGLYLVDNDPDGERHFTYWRENSAARSLFEQPADLGGIGAFYFTGITLAVVQENMDGFLRGLSRLKEDACDILFDPNYRPALWSTTEAAREAVRRVLPYCDTVLPTLEDEALLWSIDEVKACWDFYAGQGVSEIVVKAPDLTAHAWTGKTHVTRAAARVEPLDTTGAGDAFNAGYLAVRLGGGTAEEALERAQALAARVVRNQGAILPRDAT